ncbi:hypothetical protein SETIT_1G021900v2 [Setaria italica]|uniref:Protein kinase domain-containing protein n=2 Tax=Setaria italica TaxID=4555 RepID=A0A368PGC0_SETIT|nr:calmodulin-binding receptor kinase CaMRLK [Setaria italica]RCV04699.1 hypothetical protein SETIT_1G021900v2 [Setaria italica]
MKPPENHALHAAGTRKARLPGEMPLHLACRRLLLLLAAVATSPAAVAESNRSSNCTLFPDAEFVRAAFLNVTNFTPPLPGRRACRPVRRLRFPSRKLIGAVNWAELGNLSSLLTVDLSGNSLQGAISSAFWRAPLLRAVDVSRNNLDGALRFDDPSSRLASLNVSGNRFTSAVGLAGLTSLEDLDVSGNVIRTAPEGLRQLTLLRRLDLSRNEMSGRFPDDLPPLGGLVSLNISYNNFSGVVPADAVRRFGKSAFFQPGNALQVIEDDATSGRKNRRRAVVIAPAAAGAAVTAAALAFLAACVLTRRGRKKKNGKDGKAAVWEDEEVVVGAVKVAAAAPVVVLERPLMELTLADLAAATSGFGRESQLAETGGRSGAAYRAVLPGDLHVVVRVVEGPLAGVGEEDDEAATAAGFRELARFRHPNILPLLGYCIAGKQKLLLFEYMEKGDLHRWLHELPVGSMDTEDIGIDTMEAIEDRKPAGDWPTRYRVILGIARGLAFLHQGWAGSGRPIVHGRLVPTNILLGDDMEPRISDFLHPNDETPESDVYRFGTLVFELVTGQARWNETSTSWARGVIRNRKGLNLVDDRLRDETMGTEAEKEMAECLQVGLLCTASSPEKRPTMQQVVGLLKDIRPAAPAGEPSPAS